MTDSPISSDCLEQISDFIFTNKYARYRDDLKRRETWDEAVTRLQMMHLRKYSFLPQADLDKIIKAFNLVREKRIAPSFRSLQFGGKAIEQQNSRGFNCAVRHVDSIRSFAEIFHLLLCGCGVGIGVSKYFLQRLPSLVDENDKTGTVLTYVIEDTIDGWADSVEALLQCYFKNTAFTGRKIVFDFSKIRKKGSPLKTSGGKAPGYQGLKQALIKIKKLLDHIIEYRKQSELRSVDVYDILMHCADAVLSGGIRRSATIVVFDKNDEDMLTAKTLITVDRVFSFDKYGTKVLAGATTQLYEGKVSYEGIKYDVIVEEWELDGLQNNKQINWWHLYPQRARSNNSVLLVRSEITKEEFTAIIQRTKQFGEPGFVLADHPWVLCNPCQPAWAPLLTKNGIQPLSKVKIGDEIWSETGWVKVTKKWSTGIKDVHRYKTSAGVFYGTKNHQLISNGVKVEAKDCIAIDTLQGETLTSVYHDKQHIVDGMVFGDGYVHKASNNKVFLCVGKDDQDYFESEICSYIIEYRPGVGPYAYTVQTTISADEIPKTYERVIPDRFFYSDKRTTASFLRGLYTANGSICADRITLKAASKTVVEQVQMMLSSLGIASYITTNKTKKVLFDNGEYQCKESYDLNVTTDRSKFQQLIGFIQEYKQEKLNNLVNSEKREQKTKSTYAVQSSELVSTEEVFDITVDNDTHTYWSGGLNVSNCAEILFLPVTEDGVCGVQFCNLTTTNGRLVTSFEIMKENVEAYTIIGTLQAGYTDFPYYSKACKQLTEEEALLGCSITGVMDNPDILTNPDYQTTWAEYAIKVNKEWAEKIRINQAARITTLKPEGTSSLVFGTASGIHPHHAHKYFRRVQCNKEDNVYKHFKKENPHMCEESVWSANKTDDVITFLVEVPNNAVVKTDLSAIEHLEIIKSTQKHWVIPGTTPANKKPIVNNVSCTVIVDNDEWEEVIDYIFENKQFFTAVSFIPRSGDKIYPQAPMEAVTTPEDEIRWNYIKDNMKRVDYTTLKESDDKTNLQVEFACAGGNCEIV